MTPSFLVIVVLVPALSRGLRAIWRFPQRLYRWLWWPIQSIYMRNAKLRRMAAWMRARRRRLTAAFVLVSHVLGITSSINVLNEPRTPQGAIAWIVSLNTFPYIAVPAYWALGETDYDEYAIAYRTLKSDGASILEALNDRLRDDDLIVNPNNPTQSLYSRLVNLPLTRGNSAEILVDGIETFDSMFETIRNAKSYVLIEFYILQDDQLGTKLQQLLIRKAREGVRVLLLYDEYGSRGLDQAYVDELRHAGVEVYGFNPPFADMSPNQLNFRNHRKIVVVDGRVAYVGGHNVGDQYYYGSADAGAYRDTHVRVTGPLVQCCQIVFAEDWHAVSNQLLDDLDWSPQASEDDLVGLCLPSGPADSLETASLFFLHAINSARDRVWIATPYFVPDQQMVTALQLASLRGVDVRILIPSESDSNLVWLSSFSYLPELESAGIKTFRYRGRFMHQKVILIDNEYSAIGTTNFDNRSFRLNFEVMMILFDENFAKKTATMLETDFKNSTPAPATEMTEASYFFRLLVQVSRLLAPIQ